MKSINITYNCPTLKKEEHLLLELDPLPGSEERYEVKIHHIERNTIWGEFEVTRKGDSWIIDNTTNMELDNIPLVTGCDLVGLNIIKKENGPKLPQ